MVYQPMTLHVNIWIYGSSWCEHYITTTTKIVKQLHCMRSQEITKAISNQHLRKSAKFPNHLIMIIINSCSENDLVVELFNCLWQRWIETCRFSQKTPQSFLCFKTKIATCHLTLTRAKVRGKTERGCLGGGSSSRTEPEAWGDQCWAVS